MPAVNPEQYVSKIDTRSIVALIISIDDYTEFEYSDDKTKDLFQTSVRNSAAMLYNLLQEELELQPIATEKLGADTEGEQLRVSGIISLSNCTAQDVRHTLSRIANFQFSCLLLYFVGHGVLAEENKLKFAFRGYSHKTPRVDSLSSSDLFELLSVMDDRLKIVLLDCCNAGNILREVSLTQRARRDASSEVESTGYFVVAATEQASAKLFPSELKISPHVKIGSEIIRNGVPFQGPTLSIDAWFRELRKQLRKGDFDVPIRVSTIDDDLVGIFPNNAFLQDSDEVRRRMTRFSDSLSVYGRVIKENERRFNEAIDGLKNQDKSLSLAIRKGEETEQALRSEAALINSILRDKADTKSVDKRFGYVYFFILAAMVASLLLGEYVIN